MMRKSVLFGVVLCLMSIGAWQVYEKALAQSFNQPAATPVAAVVESPSTRAVLIAAPSGASGATALTAPAQPGASPGSTLTFGAVPSPGSSAQGAAPPQAFFAQSLPAAAPQGSSEAALGFTYKVTSDSHDAQLHETVQNALHQYTQAVDDNSRRTAREEIFKAIGEQFDVRQKQREDEIKQIEARVKQLRDTLQKRAASRQQILEHRLTVLLEEAEGLGWGGVGDDNAGLAVRYLRTMQSAPAVHLDRQ